MQSEVVSDFSINLFYPCFAIYLTFSYFIKRCVFLILTLVKLETVLPKSAYFVDLLTSTQFRVRSINNGNDWVIVFKRNETVLNYPSSLQD